MSAPAEERRKRSAAHRAAVARDYYARIRRSLLRPRDVDRLLFWAREDLKAYQPGGNLAGFEAYTDTGAIPFVEIVADVVVMLERLAGGAK